MAGLGAAIALDTLWRASNGTGADPGSASNFRPPSSYARAVGAHRFTRGKIRKGSFSRYGVKKLSWKGRRASFKGAQYRKRRVRLFRARGLSHRKAPGSSRRAKVAVVAKGVTVDNFTERTVTTLASSSGNEDHQVIGLASPKSGLDIEFFKNLYQTAINASPAALATSKIILYWHERNLVFHPGTTTRMNLEVTRWRPRFDSDETPTQALALASFSDNNPADKTIIGAKLFDCHYWCTAYKAVKTYTRKLWLGRSYTLRIKRKFPKGKLIDYDGQFYFATTGTYPSDVLSAYNFYQKAGLSEVITYRVWGDSLVNGSNDVISYPAVYIEDINKVGYSPCLQAAKSALQSGYNAPLHTAVTTPLFADPIGTTVAPEALT